MRLLSASLLLLVGAAVCQAQIAAVFSSVEKTSDCSSWSAWGKCFWPKKSYGSGIRTRSPLYLKQLSNDCRSHWFYKYITEHFGQALNNFFSYVSSITKDTEPCGMCSYRQSCGYGGRKTCHKLVPGRKLTPFFVAEEVCTARTTGRRQNHACKMDAAVIRRNTGRECQVWPVNERVVPLPGVDVDFRKVVYRLKWSNCVADRKNLDRNGKPIYCRCCCFPFAPDPRTYQCKLIPGKPPPPGIG